MEGILEGDLCIIGGGFTGLWAALYAKEQSPERSVILLEQARCGSGASSRNGGFLNYSLTHGVENGRSRFPDELDVIERLGMQNFNELTADLERHRIDAELELTGELAVAVTSGQLGELEARAAAAVDRTAEFLDREAMQAEIH